VEVIAPLHREHKTESALNNLVADLMLSASPGADAAFNNAGGIRIPLSQGPLRYGTLFEMFPFDNTLAILKISARQLASILAHNLEASNGILALAGLRAAASCLQGALTVQLFDQAGQLVPPDRPLTVVTSDFLAHSGDGAMSGQTLAPDAITILADRLMRDVLRDGFVSLPKGQVDGSDKRLFDPEHPRLRYPGRRPVQCTSDPIAE
jgi:2',3'-cyclic-nucleotide 2'-phosphodiesterase (5'-nucleotidase family)